MVKEGYSTGEKLGRWILYGFIISTIPFLAATVYKWWIGYTFTIFKIEYAPSFLAITISVVGNVCGYATDRERVFNKKWKSFFRLFSVITLVVCMFFYALLLNTNGIVQIKSNEQPEETSIALIDEIEIVTNGMVTDVVVTNAVVADDAPTNVAVTDAVVADDAVTDVVVTDAVVADDATTDVVVTDDIVADDAAINDANVAANQHVVTEDRIVILMFITGFIFLCNFIIGGILETKSEVGFE